MKSGGESGSFGSILKGIGELVEIVKKMDAEGKTEIKRTGTFGIFPESRRIGGSYGFTLKMGLPGRKEPASSGITHSGVGQKPVQKEREPLVDIFDESNFIRVVVELPAVADEDVVLYMNENVLYLTIRSPNGPFSKTIVLPDRVKPGAMRKSIRNGILEVIVEVKD